MQKKCNQNIDEIGKNKNTRKTLIVVLITLITMITEIVYGLITGSMALLADGIHMGTHTFALIVTLVAYLISNNNLDNPNFVFSTGKVGVLGGYTNSIILGITALYMIYEAFHRLFNPEKIIFNQALIVAIIGLVVNLISAILLSSGNHLHSHHHDHNLRSAYIHVVTDAFTSILAIIALLVGKYFNFKWPDSIVAILGAIVILKWAFDLLFSSGKLLVDFNSSTKDYEFISNLTQKYNYEIIDLHIWQLNEKNKAIIITIDAGSNVEKNALRDEIKKYYSNIHLTIEVA